MFCPDCAAPTIPGARYCPNCGRRLESPADGLQAGDRRVVTALFADLVGYTRLVDELDAEEVRTRVDAAFALLADAVVRFGGSLEKFVGDAVLAVFGAPTAHDDDAVRACLCALAMQGALAAAGQGDPQLRLRIGVSTGEVVAAVRDVAGSRSIALTGEPMTTAARLQQLAEPDEIVLDAATVAAAEPRIDALRLGDRVLRGQRRPIAVHRLVAERRVIRHPRRFGAPLVGRDDERRRIEEILERASTGKGAAVFVRGEAGVGKSRLLSEMESIARRNGFGWIWIDNVAYGRSQPYRGVRCMVDWLAEEMNLVPGVMARQLLVGPDLDEEQARRLTGAVAVLVRDSNMIMREEEGWDAATALLPVTPAEITEWLAFATRRWWTNLCAIQPRCIVVDDYHWSDPSSLALTDQMARLTAELPLVVLAGSRPGPLPGWASLPNVEVVELSGLDPAATEQLGSAVAGASLDPAVASWLHERTAGNALFIGEIVRALCETGGLERVAGQLRLADGAARDRLPLSLRALLGARIDSLPADQRAALEVASVIGMDFTEPLLRDLDPGLDGSELDELARAGLVEAVGGDDGETHHWQFRHPLFHDAAYGRLLGERRRRLHASLADLLATAEPPTTAAELARHRVAAGDLDAALPLLERAALEAASVGAAMEAAEFRRAAADLVERETWMAARWPGDDQPAASPRDRGDSAAT